MKNKKVQITVGIPTCYGGESLIGTVTSIKESSRQFNTEIIVQADRTPINPTIRKTLIKMGVKIYWNKKEGSQFKKLKQIIRKAKGSIFIFTQDDIVFDKNAITEIYKTFTRNKKITMLGTRVLPLRPEIFFESIMATMIRLVDKAGRAWNNGDNHLMASGRCLAFQTAALKKFVIPEGVVTGDAYLYLENKQIGGSFTYTKKGFVYIRPPQRLKDQMGPSSRYQYSEQELKNYFGEISNQYKIPLTAIITAFASEIASHPIQTLIYPLVYVYTRVKRQSANIVKNPIWKIDVTTKNL